MAVVALAAVGGIGFAASTAVNSAKVKIEKVTSGSAQTVAVSAVRNAASDQYVDSGRRVTQEGRPQLSFSSRPAARATENDPDITLRTSLLVNESGTLSVEVFKGRDRVTIDCVGSTVQGGSFAGRGENTICRAVINSPANLQIAIKVPSRQLNPSDTLRIQLGYVDRDASSKKTIVSTRVSAPAKLPTVTRAFTLSETNIADIRTALADDSGVEVTFKATVSRQRGLSITWGTAPAETDRTTVTRTFLQLADVPRTVTVTVTGGEIRSGDFTVKDRDTVAVSKMTAVRLFGIFKARYTFETSTAITSSKYEAVVLSQSDVLVSSPASSNIAEGRSIWTASSSNAPVSPVKIRFRCRPGQCSDPDRFSELLPTK